MNGPRDGRKLALGAVALAGAMVVYLGSRLSCDRGSASSHGGDGSLLEKAERAAPVPAATPIALGPEDAHAHDVAAFDRDAGTPPPPPSLADARAFARGSNALGLALFEQLGVGERNAVISPLALSTMLLSTWSVSGGDTAAELQRAIGLHGAPAHFADVAGGYLGAHAAEEAAVTFGLVHRLFADAQFPFALPSVDARLSPLGAAVEPVPFEDAPERARQRINEWMATATLHKIQELYPAGRITSGSRLVLAAAASFRANWAEEFPENATQPRAFRVAPGKTVLPQTMNVERGFGATSAPGARILEIPYTENAFALTIVLPNRDDGLRDLESSLSVEEIEAWGRSLERSAESLHLALPKFEIEPAESTSMTAALRGIGLNLPFDPLRADFSPLLSFEGGAGAQGRLYLDDVVEKAFIRIDETVTEAGAGVGGMMEESGRQMPPRSPRPFLVDHPFLFLVRDTRTGMILFMGHVVNPLEK
jgi:serpin B